MTSKLLAAALALAALAPVAPARAQGFIPGPVYAGPRMWVGNLNGAVALGAQAEKGLSKPGDYGPGVLAAGVGLDWYSWSYDYPSGSYDYSVVPVQVFGNYHFVVSKHPEWDPYVGLTLVYSAVSASWSGAGAQTADASGSDFDIAGQGGVRYFLSEKFALQAQVGFGYGTLGLGATWRL